MPIQRLDSSKALRRPPPGNGRGQVVGSGPEGDLDVKCVAGCVPLIMIRYGDDEVDDVAQRRGLVAV